MACVARLSRRARTMYSPNMGAGYTPMAPAPQRNSITQGCSLGCAIVCLIALIILAVPAIWLGIPAWHVRTQGVQTEGTASLIESCGTSRDENGNEGAETFQVSIRFTDQQGRSHEVGSHWACNN